MELYSRGWRIFWGGVVIVLMLGCAGLAIFVGAVRDGAAAPVVTSAATQAPAPEPAVVVRSTPRPTVAPTGTSVPATAVNPTDPIINSYVYLNGAWPMHDGLRARVRHGGDVARFYIGIVIDVPHLVFQRVIADDEFTQILYFTPTATSGIDILPLLHMNWVTSGTVGAIPAEHLSYLASRGVNITDGEILMQNLYSVDLGAVPAGSYFLLSVRDDEALQVNRGVTYAFSADSDPFTVDLEGELVTHPTFVIKATP